MEEALGDAGESLDRPVRRAHRVRWPFVIAGVAALSLAIGSFVWSNRVPAYRPALQRGERLGVDVSGHQGGIDWPRVASDDIRFAYIKATEGGDFVDDRFASNWHAAKAAGLERGAYHFFTLCRPGVDQADNFLETVPADPAALPPAVDLELTGNCSGRPTRDELVSDLRAFIDKVEGATGQRIVVYVLEDFEAEYHVRDALDRPFWSRSLLQRPDADDWTIWQVNSETKVAGIEGGVDLNVARSPL